MDEPARLRKAQYLHLSGMMQVAMGEGEEAAARVAESAALNNDNMFAVVYAILGITE